MGKGEGRDVARALFANALLRRAAKGAVVQKEPMEERRTTT